MGGLMILLWTLRVFVFTLYESPKYLVGKGRDEEALRTVHHIAAYNRTTSSMKAEDLSVSHSPSHGNSFSESTGHVRFCRDRLGTIRGLSTTTAAESNRIRALFSGPQMARSTTLLILTWGEFFTEGLYLILYSPTL